MLLLPPLLDFLVEEDAGDEPVVVAVLALPIDLAECGCLLLFFFLVVDVLRSRCDSRRVDSLR